MIITRFLAISPPPFRHTAQSDHQRRDLEQMVRKLKKKEHEIQCREENLPGASALYPSGPQRLGPAPQIESQKNITRTDSEDNRNNHDDPELHSDEKNDFINHGSDNHDRHDYDEPETVGGKTSRPSLTAPHTTRSSHYLHMRRVHSGTTKISLLHLSCTFLCYEPIFCYDVCALMFSMCVRNIYSWLGRLRCVVGCSQHGTGPLNCVTIMMHRNLGACYEQHGT